LVLRFETSNSSQRVFAQRAGVPRSTLQHWLKVE
jgi:DNA-binding transcriptional regulator YiaG